MSSMPVDVMILDGDENQAVASVRDLGKAGFRVCVAESFRWSKAALSRYAHQCFVYSSPRSDKLGFRDDLLKFIGSYGDRGIVLLPMTETTTLAVSESRDVLRAAGYRLVLPEHSSLLRAFDKHETSVIAQSLGIDVPQQVTIERAADITRLDELRMPVVVKATASNVLLAGELVAAPRPSYASSLAEAQRLVNHLLAMGFPVIAQEFVQGVGVGFFALYDQGVLQRSFAHQRIRDVHPTGSGSSYRVSVDVHADLLHAGSSILNRLDWHGPAMVEFKRTREGRLVFLEVNGRLWGSLSLAVAANAHFPRWMVSLANGESVEAQLPTISGVHCRWLLGDLRHLIAVVRGKPKGFPGPFPARAATVRAMISGLGTDSFDNFELGDPLPELGDWLSTVRKSTRALKQILARRGK